MTDVAERRTALRRAVLSAALNRGIEAHDWGDAVSLEFPDGCDAYWVGPRDLDAAAERDPIDFARDVLDEHARLADLRRRCLLGIRHALAETGKRLRMTPYGQCWWHLDDSGRSELAVGHELTRAIQERGLEAAFAEITAWIGPPPGSEPKEKADRRHRRWLSLPVPPTNERYWTDDDERAMHAKIDAEASERWALLQSKPKERRPEPAQTSILDLLPKGPTPSHVAEDVAGLTHETIAACDDREAEILAGYRAHVEKHEEYHVTPPWHLGERDDWLDVPWLVAVCRKRIDDPDSRAAESLNALVELRVPGVEEAARKLLPRWEEWGEFDEDYGSSWPALYGLHPVTTYWLDVVSCERSIRHGFLPARRAAMMELRSRIDDVAREADRAAWHARRVLDFAGALGAEWLPRVASPEQLAFVRDACLRMLGPEATPLATGDRALVLLKALRALDDATLGRALLARPGLAEQILEYTLVSEHFGDALPYFVSKAPQSPGDAGAPYDGIRWMEPLLIWSEWIPEEPAVVRIAARALLPSRTGRPDIHAKLSAAIAWRRCRKCWTMSP